jgi:uncharacterized protein YbjT (DUF2867 family)
MSATKQTILVTGATGKQGGALAHRLLERGHAVRALTRKPESDAAKALAAKGATLVQGDLSDRASIDRALAGATSVFSMSTPFEAGEAAETLQGVTVADAAKAAGAFLLYTSVGGADKKTGVPHFESKWKVEEHIAKIGARATVIAPVYFMSNALMFGGAEQLKKGVYGSPLTPTRKLAQVAVEDIGAVALAVLETPERYVGKRYDLAGDDLSGQEVVAILGEAIGKPYTYFQVPMQAIRSMSEDMALMYEWFEKVGYTFDPAALRKDFPEVQWTSFATWAGKQDWAKILA